MKREFMTIYMFNWPSGTTVICIPDETIVVRVILE